MNSTPLPQQAAEAAPQRDATLDELDFIDIYVPINVQAKARFNPRPRPGQAPQNLAVPSVLDASLALLATQLREMRKDETSINFQGLRLRASRKTLANGETWVCMRKVESGVKTLEQLRFSPKLIPLIRDMGQRSGLVIVAGATGQGKTTTVNAFLGDWLGRYGQVAVTIEDPVEFDLHGPQGKNGFCYQIEVDDDLGWAPALKTALRWHPRYILVGEIRTPDAASQLLRAANSGHLVITTLHSGGLEETLAGLIQIAEQAVGARAATLVGDALVGVFHQTLSIYGPFLRFLFSNPEDSRDAIRGAIKEGKLQMLSTYIKQQEARVYGQRGD